MCITDTSLNFYEHMGCVLMNKQLYYYDMKSVKGQDGAHFLKVSNIDSLRTLTMLAKPRNHGLSPALTGYEDSHLFLTGG